MKQFSIIYKFSNFKLFSQKLNEIQLEASRNKKIQIFSDFLKDLTNVQRQQAILLFSGKSLGDRITQNVLIKSVKDYYKFDNKLIKSILKKGYIHDIAYEVDLNYFQNEKSLDLDCLNQRIQNIKDINGINSEELKYLKILDLYKQLTNNQELYYLLKIFEQKLRLGFSEQSLIQSLQNIDQQLFQTIYGKNLMQNLQVGIPVGLMLSSPSKDSSLFIQYIDDVKKFFDKFQDNDLISEYKYDGQRTQIHLKNQDINMFSRSQENQNLKFKYLYQKLYDYFDENDQIQNIILDGEIVAFDQQTQQICNFIELQTKKESYTNIIEKVYIFDILLFNDQNVIEKSLIERKQILNQIIKQNEFIKLVNFEQLNSKSQNFEEIINKNLQNAKDNRLMLKSSQSKYQENTRKFWTKLKVSSNGLMDTLDLVPIAGYYGKGKRSNTFGAYLMGCYNSKNQRLEAICKLGTGFSDQDLSNLYDFYKDQQINEHKYIVNKSIKPDVWLKPCQVWEIECDSLSEGEMYSVGLNNDFSRINFTNCDFELQDSNDDQESKKKGISLRFPRFLKIRNDKFIKDTTQDTQILDMFLQSQNRYNKFIK